MEIAPDPLFELTIGSHFFRVNKLTPRVVGLMYRFCTDYIQYTYVKGYNKRPQLKPTKIYAARSSDNTEFRFHIGQYERFLRMLESNHIEPNLYITIILPKFKPASVKMKANAGWELREYQQNAVDFNISKQEHDNSSRLVTMPTGSGKGVTSLFSVMHFQERVLIVVLPSYTVKWAAEISQILNVKPKEIMIIQGSDNLKGLISLAADNVPLPKFIIISLTTIRNWYKTYELNSLSSDTSEYGCHPEDLCKVLRIGSVIIDETHQHLHAVFKFLLYTHVNKVIALSATFITNDPFIDKVHHLMFPKEIRFDSIKMDKYIKLYAISYEFKHFNPDRIRSTEYGSNMYSHVAFEKSIMKSSHLLTNYLKFIKYMVDTAYAEHYIPGDKLAIYAASIAMCDHITAHIKREYPQYDVRRYVEEDPYENVIDADIRVTTVLSAGTAIDIPNLRAVIMTNNILSPVANIQSLGRLRNLKDRDVKFYYTYCTQIKKQVEFHRNRIELFKERTASIKEFRSPILI